MIWLTFYFPVRVQSLCERVSLNHGNLQAKPAATDNVKTNEVSSGQSNRAATDSEAEHWLGCDDGKLSEKITGAQLQECDLVPCPRWGKSHMQIGGYNRTLLGWWSKNKEGRCIEQCVQNHVDIDKSIYNKVNGYFTLSPGEKKREAACSGTEFERIQLITAEHNIWNNDV